MSRSESSGRVVLEGETGPATKHTPGPWRADGKTVRHANETCRRSPPVAMCDLTHGMGDAHFADLANARLIAAAPELKEALAAVIEAHCANSDRIFCGTCSTARKLLARIDGDTK